MKSFKQLINEENSIIAYHGTNTENINKFTVDRGRAVNDVAGGGGAYFTTNKDVAINYAKSAIQRKDAKGSKPWLYTVRLTPSRIEDIGTQTGKQTRNDNDAIKFTIPEKSGKVLDINWRIPEHDVYIIYDAESIQLVKKEEIPKEEIKRVVNSFNK